MPSRDHAFRADTDRVTNVGADVDAAADMYLYLRTTNGQARGPHAGAQLLSLHICGGKSLHPHDCHAQLYSQAPVSTLLGQPRSASIYEPACCRSYAVPSTAPRPWFLVTAWLRSTPSEKTPRLVCDCKRKQEVTTSKALTHFLTFSTL